MDSSPLVKLASDSDALSAWIFWFEMLELPNAKRLVFDMPQANSDLHLLYLNGIGRAPMEEWLRQWPTPFGLSQFQRLNTARFYQTG